MTSPSRPTHCYNRSLVHPQDPTVEIIKLLVYRCHGSKGSNLRLSPGLFHERFFLTTRPTDFPLVRKDWEESV